MEKSPKGRIKHSRVSLIAVAITVHLYSLPTARPAPAE